ncbi:MAG: DnaB-like helicase N-terminal domain-containing protein, partial [Pirellulales bacterium]
MIHHDTPPSDPDSERALLGAILVDPTQLDSLSDLVTGRDFSDTDLGRLFDALAILREGGVPINDPTAVAPDLARMGIPESVRSLAFLAELIGSGIAWNATHYAKQVARCAALRRQHDIVTQAAASIVCGDDDPDQIAQWLEGQMQGIGQRTDSPVRSIGDIARALVDDLQAGPASTRRGIMTGLLSHDGVVGAWMPGELVILAARPAVGKTSLALQVALHNAGKDRPVLFV